MAEARNKIFSPAVPAQGSVTGKNPSRGKNGGKNSHPRMKQMEEQVTLSDSIHQKDGNILNNG